MRLGVGARGPQDGVRPAAGAIELHDTGLTFGQEFAALAAPDFFENFLLHDGVKSLHPNENLSIVPLVSPETHDRRILCG